MRERIITAESMQAFGQHLEGEERSTATVEKYLRELRRFAVWQAGGSVTKASVAAWKAYLLAEHYNPATVNGKLAALNAFFAFVAWEDCRVKSLKLQRRLFRDASRELTQPEYRRLLETANSQGRERLALVIETMGATGIRVSELRYITLEAARLGRAEIALKGKIRTILLPGKLCRKLTRFSQKQKIASGELFLSKSGCSLSRKQVWAELKRLCGAAGVEPTRVFPHNLRHLFARCFYKACRDVAKLADVLGHSSIETTRLYLISTGAEHAQILARLGLMTQTE